MEIQLQELIEQIKKDGVTAAEEKSASIINEAEAYRNEILPKARGQAAAMRNQAEAYTATRVQTAQGEAARFDALRQEYEKAPKVTKQRLYYETAEDILASSGEKVLMDGGAAERVMPYLPLPGLAAPHKAGMAAQKPMEKK